jgi:hypothetical protein
MSAETETGEQFSTRGICTFKIYVVDTVQDIPERVLG